MIVKHDYEDGATSARWTSRAPQAPGARRPHLSERFRRRANSTAGSLSVRNLGFAFRFRSSLVHPGFMLRSVVGAEAANIMPGPVRFPSAYLTSVLERERSATRQYSASRGPRPGGDFGRPAPSGATATFSVFARGGRRTCGGSRQAAPAAAGRAKRKSAPSSHIRCRITPIRRAIATTARFIPRRRAICRPQAFSQHGLA